VISDPPGARIELDDGYIGDALLEIQWDMSSTSELFIKSYEVKALPIYEGQYVQQKFFWRNDRIPKTILFDMYLAPAPQRYELEID